MVVARVEAVGLAGGLLSIESQVGIWISLLHGRESPSHKGVDFPVLTRA